MEQNTKAHKEEECTSDWRNLEKIRRESRGRTAHNLVTVSLSGVVVCYF
jgi:hypothetical protein